MVTVLRCALLTLVFFCCAVLTVHSDSDRCAVLTVLAVHADSVRCAVLTVFAVQCSLFADELPEEYDAVQLSELVVFIDPLDGTREFVQGRLEAVQTLIGISWRGVCATHCKPDLRLR